MKTEEIIEYLDGMIAEMVADGQHDGAMRVGVVRDELVNLKRRYTWAANELLACDYGDNDHPSKTFGWRVYGWRSRGGERRIYGDSIDMAIDIEALKTPHGE